MQTSAPRVHVHTGEDLVPGDRADLPDAVREAVEAHLRMSDAPEVEIRHYGDGVFSVIHRYGSAEDESDASPPDVGNHHATDGLGPAAAKPRDTNG